jgi:hypothetical protein
MLHPPRTRFECREPMRCFEFLRGVSIRAKVEHPFRVIKCQSGIARGAIGRW